MERLTIRNSDGSVSQPTSTTIQAVFEKLAAYEDTGMKPEEMKFPVVVHCAHCHYAESRKPIGIKTEIFCSLFCAGMRAHDFCSRGVKMEVSDDA